MERELALGYAPGTTAAEQVSDRKRHEALGRCMDTHYSPWPRLLSHAPSGRAKARRQVQRVGRVRPCG
jgi:hypothetical protein